MARFVFWHKQTTHLNGYFKFVMVGVVVITAVLYIASILMCWLLNGHFDVAQVFHPFQFVLVKRINLLFLQKIPINR